MSTRVIATATVDGRAHCATWPSAACRVGTVSARPPTTAHARRAGQEQAWARRALLL